MIYFALFLLSIFNVNGLLGMYSYSFFSSPRVVAVSLLGISLSVSACTGGVPGKVREAAAATKTVQVQALPAELKELRRNVQAVGSLFAQEEVTVSSEVEGKVDSVLVDVGDRVEAGQPIVKVSTVELSLALQQQRALYQQARARLGLTGSSDDLANVTDAAEVKKAAADLKEAEDVYQRARLLLDKAGPAATGFRSDRVPREFRASCIRSGSAGCAKPSGPASAIQSGGRSC